MLELRPRISKSWLDTRAARRLSAELRERLLDRCRGEQGVFITLTYRRDEWDDARHLYRASSEERHVRRFVERLSQLMGESLTGRWICKLEFQRGGWVHFHLLLLGTRHIDHGLLEHAWGYGYVWIERMNPKRIRYVCKYVAKGDSLPEFLYLEPCRSVKIVRVSPGFWGESDRPPRPKSEPSQKLSAYVPLGMLIERAEHETIVRDTETGRYCRFEAGMGELVIDMLRRGARCIGMVKGWVGVDGFSWKQLHEWRPPARADAARFHSIENRNPPSHHAIKSCRAWRRND